MLRIIVKKWTICALAILKQICTISMHCIYQWCLLKLLSRNENTDMSRADKLTKFRRGGSKEYPQSMFLSRNNKNNVYSYEPQFFFIKVGFKGVKIIKACFHDEFGWVGISPSGALGPDPQCPQSTQIVAYVSTLLLFGNISNSVCSFWRQLNLRYYVKKKEMSI